MDHSFFMLQLHHTCLFLVKQSPDVATTDSDHSCLIAANVRLWQHCSVYTEVWQNIFISRPQEDERL